MLARLLICSLLVFAASCSLPRFSMPRVHKITIQQGNLITQEMVDQLKPGMTRSQVEFVMGKPIAHNTFNIDRWDYIYTVIVPGVFQEEKRMSLYFENDVLAYFTGDLVPTGTGSDTEAQNTASSE
ncbi:MAG: outer membrane protein assembly factor BamE [Gammaproteobacteria bacterium]|nr:outer membrane protein assembly factor BamE [Gammaproteobacteria bacterium]MCZ6853601.1 outer membrane protein assembly factor BamE [Gammaproteobacteria bacterium]